MKHRVKLTESALRRIVKESLRRVLDEYGNTGKGQKALGALMAKKVINADGDTVDDFFKNQSEKGGEVYNYAKQQRSEYGKDTDEIGNTINPLYKEFSKGYCDYLNAQPLESSKRHDRLRKLGYYS